VIASATGNVASPGNGVVIGIFSGDPRDRNVRGAPADRDPSSSGPADDSGDDVAT
jgi:hypothetical protein